MIFTQEMMKAITARYRGTIMVGYYVWRTSYTMNINAGFNVLLAQDGYDINATHPIDELLECDIPDLDNCIMLDLYCYSRRHDRPRHREIVFDGCNRVVWQSHGGRSDKVSKTIAAHFGLAV